MTRSIARLQTLWIRLFVLAVILPFVVEVPESALWPATLVVLGLTFVRPPRGDAEPRTVKAPVRGRWVAHNSPGSSVPSHRTRAYGQTYAIDLAEAHPRARPGWGLGLGRPEDSPAFGAPVTAMAGGTVVSATTRQRDHRTRASWPSMLAMIFVEGLVRELLGPRFLLGNHVIVDHGGYWSVSAHLRRDSVTVAVGDHMEAGDPLGEIGNSGNSSRPHLHAQLMDRPDVRSAAGVPFRWERIAACAPCSDDVPQTDPLTSDGTPFVPANGQIFVA